MSSPKKIKQPTDIDRLSSLPEAIIHHILSFLDMKVVVKTSLLSKRWTHTWKSVPYLNFHLGELPRVGKKDIRNRFMNFVDRVLVLRNDSNIEKFSVYSQDGLDGSRVETWIVGALGRHVQELCINTADCYEHLILPCHLFGTSSDIKVVELCSVGNCLTKLPRSVCTFARVKSLVLRGVEFPDGNSNGEIVLSCGGLENLVMNDCHYGFVKVFTISSPLLENLELLNPLIDETDSIRVNVCCPDLKSLKCVSWRCLDCCLGDVSSLASAEIDICIEEDAGKELKEVCAKSLIKVLRGISNVRSLTLSTLSIKILTEFPDLFESIPEFRNLRCMVLMDCLRIPIHAVVSFLGRLPSIKTLVWNRNQAGLSSNVEGEDSRDTLPLQSTFAHLNIFELQDPEGSVDELRFLEFLLKKAVVIKKMSIKTMFKYSLNEMKVEEFEEKVLGFPRASPCVSISFLRS